MSINIICREFFFSSSVLCSRIPVPSRTTYRGIIRIIRCLFVCVCICAILFRKNCGILRSVMYLYVVLFLICFIRPLPPPPGTQTSSVGHRSVHPIDRLPLKASTRASRYTRDGGATTRKHSPASSSPQLLTPFIPLWDFRRGRKLLGCLRGRAKPRGSGRVKPRGSGRAKPYGSDRVGPGWVRVSRPDKRDKKKKFLTRLDSTWPDHAKPVRLPKHLLTRPEGQVLTRKEPRKIVEQKKKKRND